MWRAGGGCGEQEAGVASGSGLNLWVWLLGVVVRRYIDFLILLIPTPLVSVLFYSSIPTLIFHSPPQPAVACNPELSPISHYYVTISGLAGNLTVAAADSPTTFSTSFPELRKDSNYTVNVQTCTAYMCEETPASVAVGRAICAVVSTICFLY